MIGFENRIDDAAVAATARQALGEWLAWPDAGRDGPRVVDNAHVISWLGGVPSRLASRVPPISPELVERIAAAISDADARFGFRCHLTRLIDGEATYTLTIAGCSPMEFPGHDEAMEYVGERKDRARAEAVIAALRAAA